MVGRQYSLGELVAGVDDDRLDGATVQGALTHDLHVLAALAEVDRYRYDLTAGLLAYPADRHRGVQTAGIRQDDAFGPFDMRNLLYFVYDVSKATASSAPVIGFAGRHEDRVISGDGADDVR